jgi:hypothetical protein
VADFPTTFKIETRSKRLDRDGRVIDVDGDGIAHVRKVHPDKADFELYLSRMTSADVTSLFSHYNANGSTFNFTWPPDASVYVVKYGARPSLEEFKKTGYYTYKVKLLAGA